MTKVVSGHFMAHDCHAGVMCHLFSFRSYPFAYRTNDDGLNRSISSGYYTINQRGTI